MWRVFIIHVSVRAFGDALSKTWMSGNTPLFFLCSATCSGEASAEDGTGCLTERIARKVTPTRCGSSGCMTDLQLLRVGRLRLFAGMSETQIAEVVRLVGGRVRRHAKGAVIEHEGSKASWLVSVLSGVVSVYEPGANGERHLVRTVEAGQLFGATLVTMRLENYPGMAVAATDCEVAIFDMAKIRELWYDMRYRKFFENLYTVVSEYVLFCWRKLSIMACKTTEDKFMMYLNWYASETGSNDLKIPFPRMEDCATFLGVTRVSLSIAIGRLEKRGEIKHVGRGHFKLLRPDFALG